MRRSEGPDFSRVARKLLAVALPVLLLLGVVEAQLRGMNTVFSLKREILDRRASETDVLILGSSHALYGVNPSQLGAGATNAAGFSQSLRCDVGIAMRYLDRMPHLRTVVITLSYLSLRFLLREHEPWREFFYRHYFGVPEEDPPALRWRPSDFLFLANYGNRQTRMFLANGFVQELPIEAAGWLPADQGAQAARPLTEATGKAAANRHLRAMRASTVPENVRLLSRFVGVLRGRGVRVVLATLPVFHTYSRHMSADVHRELREAAHTIVQGGGVLFRDYLADRRFVRNDFFDDDHLGAGGATKFTRILREECF